MAPDRDALRDWHRLFGLILTDFFTDSPFTVDIERDLSLQQQFLDVVILRRGRGRFHGQLPDGLDDLAAHNLVTFKSHREALDAWAVKELLGHYVAYRKLVSPSPTELLAEEQFRLYAVCARFPHNLAVEVPWQQRQEGVYDCRWGTDVVRVVVAGQLPRQENNAPLHLFSAQSDLVGYGRTAYRQRSENTSQLLQQLLEDYQGEVWSMSFTMEDFKQWFVVRHFNYLTPEQQDLVLARMPPEVLESLGRKVIATMSEEEIRKCREQALSEPPPQPRKPRRKK